MWLSLKLLVACIGLSVVVLPLVGAESIWVGLGETAALRIYLFIVIKNTHGSTLGCCIHDWSNCIFEIIVVFEGFWFSAHVPVLYQSSKKRKKKKDLLAGDGENPAEKRESRLYLLSVPLHSAVPCLESLNHVIALYSSQGGELCSSSISQNNVGFSAYGQIPSPVLWSSLPSAGQNNTCCSPSPRHSSVLTSSTRHFTFRVFLLSLILLIFFFSFTFPDHLKTKILLPNYPACSQPPCQGVSIQYVVS